MKRRILSSLMALVLVFGLLPVSAMAEASDWDPLTNPDNVYGSLDTSRSYNKQYSTTFTIGAGIGQLKAMPILDTSNASYNAMAYCGAKAVSSDPDVVEVNTKDGHQDIVIGNMDVRYVVGNGKVQAVLLKEPANIKNIRVLLLNEGSPYYENVYLTSGMKERFELMKNTYTVQEVK